MATFTNQATLTYNGQTTTSNVTVGELTETLTAAKTAVVPTYGTDGRVTYILSLVNSGTAPLTGLTITDDLGGYAFNAGTVYPLSYTAGSVRYYQNGVLQAAPAVTAGPPLTFTGITVPAGGNAVIAYEAVPTAFAPPTAEGTVTNSASVTGAGLTNPVTATETVAPEAAPALTINKSLSPTTVTENSRLTYTFTIQNTTKEMRRKLMMALMRVPMGKMPTVTLSKSVWPLIRVMMGLMMESTTPLTMAVKAPPMTTPTARSMTLPREMKVLNSLKNFFIGRFLSYSLVSECSPLQGSLV